MKPFVGVLVFGFALAVVACKTSAAEIEIVSANATERIFRQLESSGTTLEPIRAAQVAQKPVVGLATSVLRTGALQPSSGLGQASRGLTSAEEWRRLFPRRSEK
jgi:hypothetical protein